MTEGVSRDYRSVRLHCAAGPIGVRHAVNQLLNGQPLLLIIVNSVVVDFQGVNYGVCPLA